MRVLITGATGFIGAWTAKAVQERGHRLRLLVRDPMKLAPIAAALGFDATDTVAGDMTDSGRVADALHGCEAVVHAAAVVALKAEEARDMIEANLEGARNVVGQGAAQGIERIVYVSSSVVFWHPGCKLVYADLPLRGGGDDYANSKVRVEQYVRELQQQGAPVSITYPCTVLGPPACHELGESGEGVSSFLKSGIPGRGAGLTIVDVRDVADVHARLLETGPDARRYIVGGHHLSGAGLARYLSANTGRTVRHFPVPDSVLMGAGKLADRFRSRLPASLSEFSEAGARYLTGAPRADNVPVERDLGVVLRPAEEALGEVCVRTCADESAREDPGGMLAREMARRCPTRSQYDRRHDARWTFSRSAMSWKSPHCSTGTPVPWTATTGPYGARFSPTTPASTTRRHHTASRAVATRSLAGSLGTSYSSR